jgi:hypothetical protein
MKVVEFIRQANQSLKELVPLRIGYEGEPQTTLRAAVSAKLEHLLPEQLFVYEDRSIAYMQGDDTFKIFDIHAAWVRDERMKHTPRGEYEAVLIDPLHYDWPEDTTLEAYVQGMYLMHLQKQLKQMTNRVQEVQEELNSLSEIRDEVARDIHNPKPITLTYGNQQRDPSAEPGARVPEGTVRQTVSA